MVTSNPVTAATLILGLYRSQDLVVGLPPSCVPLLPAGMAQNIKFLAPKSMEAQNP
jgi:hypothetical protein